MNRITDIFDNRELALIIWLSGFSFWAVSKQKIRKSILDIIRALFAKTMLVSILLMLSYIAFMIYVFNKVGLWDKSMIKVTFYWFFGSAFILFMNSTKINKNDNYLKKIILDSLKLVIVLELVVNFYSFHLLIELLLAPIFFILFAFKGIAEIKEEHAFMKNIVDFILGLFGTAFIIYALYKIVGDFKNFATLVNLQELLLPPALTITFLPFIYLTALYAAYELLFVRIGFFMKDSTLFKYTKRQILYAFHFDLKSLNQWSKQQGVIKFTDKKEVQATLNNYKKIN